MTEAIKIDSRSKILITGATGLVGRALSRILREETGADIVGVGSRDCDLRDGGATEALMDRVRPDFVFHLAARVHGLGGNARYKSDILFENVLINTNVVEYARRSGVKKIVAMGSGCVYPELKGQQELFEDQIWLGPPHSSEDSYAHAKRLMLAQLDAAREQYGLSSAFVISGNLYGPHDLFNPEDGHVTPSLVAKFHTAAQKGEPVKVWGSGVAVRDFTYCDDAAGALLAIFRHLEGPVNMGSGMRHPIQDIVDTLHEATGVPVEWEADKPDGQLVRYYNLDRLASTGFAARVALRDGVRKTYEWYCAHIDAARK